MKKALICYWGLIRGFKYPDTIQSHKTHIWDVLTKQGYAVDVFVHTYNKQFDLQTMNIENIKYIAIEDDKFIEQKLAPRMKNVHMPVYFTEEHRMGLFKCWYSQQHLAEKIKKCHKEYDVVITLDIAQLFVTSLPSDLCKMDMNVLYTSDFEKFTGYNPRFCMSSADNIIFYLSKLDYVLQDEENIPDGMIDPNYQNTYCALYMLDLGVKRDEVKMIPNLHPEWQLKHYLDHVGKKKVKELGVKFFRIRDDAHVEGLTEKDVKLYKLSVVPD
jgi:hypothetical protein